jgi:hypothetical protein
MAISTNSTTLTRRNVLTGIGAASTALVPMAVVASAAPVALSTTDVDAVLVAWRQWWAFGQERSARTDEMLDIWETLPKQVREPRIFLFHCKWMKEDVYGKSEADIHRAWPDETAGPGFVNDPANVAKRQAARTEKLAELKAARAAAEAEMERTGYAWRDDRCTATYDEQCDKVDFIVACPSKAPAAVAAKLSIALAIAIDYANDKDPGWPWDLVRGALADLLPSLPTEMHEIVGRQIGSEAFA